MKHKTTLFDRLNADWTSRHVDLCAFIIAFPLFQERKQYNGSVCCCFSRLGRVPLATPVKELGFEGHFHGLLDGALHRLVRLVLLVGVGLGKAPRLRDTVHPK